MGKLYRYKSWQNELGWGALSIVISFAMTLIMVSDLIYNFTIVGYLRYDMLVHFIGWDYFRHSPWEWPVTYTSGLLYPIGTNLIYSDSFPLLSVILKLFSSFLPDPFIWHGLAAVINFSLLFYSGSLYFRVMRQSQLLGLIGGCFILISAPAIFRLGFHYSLTSQWLLVFNLLLVMKSQIRLKWDVFLQGLLLFLSCGIHPYLAVMNLGLAFALLYKLSSYYSPRFGSRVTFFIMQSILLCSIFLLSAYFWGWFIEGASSSAVGYGYYSANLLTFINPAFGSIMLPNLTMGSGQYEGYAYLGLGVITMVVVVLIFQRKLVHSEFFLNRLVGLYLILFMFFLLALSNIIEIGGYKIALPYGGKFFDVFRSSGRFIWPLFYFVMLSSIMLFYDIFKNKQLGLLVIFVLFFIQYTDLKPLINNIASLHATNRSPVVKWNNGLHSQFWYQLKRYNYNHIVIPEDYPGEVANLSLWWGDNHQFPVIYKFALLAVLNNITINEMHLARRSRIQDDYILHQNQLFKQGFLESQTLYIVKSDILSQRNSQLNKLQCSSLDGYNICADHFPSIVSGGR